MKIYIIILGFLFSTASFAQKEFGLDDVHKSALRIIKLNISNEKLIELPIEIANCVKIKEFNFSNNQISQLPSWIANFKSLEILDISGNRNLNIQQAFKIISKLPNLRVLKASGCRMLYLPVSIRKIKTLREVDLSNNFISSLPPIFEKVLWAKLDLSANCIDTLSPSMVYMTSLQELNLSYCPAAYNKYNYYLLEYLTNIKTLILSGMNEIPIEIGKLSFLEELIITNGTISDLPEEIKYLNKLKHVDIRGCEKLNVSDFIERISLASKKMESLKIGHLGLNGLPYNMFKLKKLKRLYVDHSCIGSLPSSFSKFKGRAIFFRNCSFSTPEKVFKHLGQARKLEQLEINDCVFGHNNWRLSNSLTLKKIAVINCGLVRLPLDPKGFPNLKKLNLKGNRIPVKSIIWTVPKTFIDAHYTSVSYPKSEISKWETNSIRPDIRRVIYSEIGDIFTLASGTEIEIEKMSFITTGNQTVAGDVELQIKEFFTKKDFLLSNYPTFLPSNEVSNVQYSVEIRAFFNGKEVYIKSDKAIVIKPELSKKMALDKFYYLKYKNEWTSLKQQVNVCSKKSNREVRAVCPDFSNLPQKKNRQRVSKVHLRIKRNKRRGTLNFEIAPEYGYLENHINIFGDRIKGYPELKTYKNIKWRYVGDSLDKDLERLYFLSESAKKEKINRKSSFYFYVLDIKDIRVFPNPNDDNYLIQFIQGRDTFSVEALPFVPILKAKKIQKWHKRKYKRYRRGLAKRKAKWLDMDTTYLNNYNVFENKLERYRQLDLKSGYYFEPKKENKKNGQVLKIYKPGLYALSIPLLINNGVLKKPIYFLKGKRFYPRRVLVSNISKNYHFWTESKAIIKERGVYEISIVLKGISYSGKWGLSNKVEFEKMEL